MSLSTEMPDFDRDTLGLATLRTAVSVGHDNSPTLRGGSQEALPCRCFIDMEGRGESSPRKVPHRNRLPCGVRF
jgi:hypothetical protein